MRKQLSLLIVLLFAATTVFAQSRREWLEFGDKAFDEGNYKLALACYQHVVKLAPGSDRDLVTPYECRPYTPPKKMVDSVALKNAQNDTTKVNPNLVEGNDAKTLWVVHRIAECYRMMHDYDNAELWYAQAVAKPDKRFPDAVYYYGVTLQNNAKYHEAIVQFEAYQHGKDPESLQYRRATRNIGGCLNAQDSTRIKREVIVTKLDSNINAGTATFAAGYYGDPDVLLFSSARPGNASTDERTKQGLDQYYTDLFIVKRMNGVWMTPQPVVTSVGQLNSPENEGAASVSFGREHLFFTRWNEEGTECSVYMCRNMGEVWLAPQKLNANVNVPGTKSMMPFLSNDGSTLYFVSDRPGGQGGLDIWKCQLDEEGNPGEAVNMGPAINTADDEITPFYHFTSSTLFYSSNGLSGYGGFDIVKSSYNADDNTWSSPKNLDAPFNSSRDDAYFTMDRVQQHGYFSSDREKCEACGPGSGYCYKAYAFQNEPLKFAIQGHVYNVETNEPIGNALLTFKDVRGDNEPFYIITDSSGYYESELTLNQELYIKAQKNKYFGDATNISTVGLTDDSLFIHDFYLTPIPAGEITIPGIEYDFDKATLRPESKKILDDLAAFLELNDNLSVEIASHTDARGSDSYNQRLSQARAKSCVDYLISKGIAADRLVATGYGESKPLITETDINALPTKEEQESAHQKNRRTSFRPIKEGVIMDKWEGKQPNK
jgi:outer membrane protein OmpA-like peptidoglycan-associated protein/tetratricopeptide (TPR) repeat protein